MSKYLVEASRKAGLFDPYEPCKHYLMSQERLSKMILQSALWAVWSAKWVMSGTYAIRSAEKHLRRNRSHRLRATRAPFSSCALTTA